MTSRGWWKQRERDSAALFGAKRQPGSGSGGREDETCSDSRHPRLFIETKVKAKHTTRTLWEKTNILAKKEKKVPLLMLFDKGKHGGLMVFHAGDFYDVAIEYLAAMPEELILSFEAAVRVARGIGEES